MAKNIDWQPPHLAEAAAPARPPPAATHFVAGLRIIRIMVSIPDSLLRRHLRPLSTPTSAQGAGVNPRIRLWVLRSLVPLGGHRSFIRKHDFSDDSLAMALGLGRWVDLDSEDFSPRPILAELRRQHLQAEQRSERARLPAHLDGNIKRLSRLAGLDAPESDLLAFITCLHNEPLLEAATDLLGSITSARLPGLLAGLLCLPATQVRQALHAQAALARSGLATSSHSTEPLRHKLELLSGYFADAMLLPHGNPLNLLRGMIAKADRGHLKLSDFAHSQAHLDLALPWLRHAMGNDTCGVNLLIHGRPGTGKSQLARTLASTLRSELFEVAHQDEDGDPVDGGARLKSFRAAQCFLAKRRALMVFDEIEDVFSGHHGNVPVHHRKAWLNHMLETNPVPTLWLSNDIRSMDRAFIRRFDMVFELPIPPHRQRAKILRAHCKGLLDDGQIAAIAQLDQLAPAIVTRASRVVHAVRDDIGQHNTARAMQLLIDNSLQAQRLPTLSSATVNHLPEVYDPQFIRADVDLAEVASGLRNTRNGRLCLYGPPGTGKTAYARWLAQQLDIPLQVKRVSNLVSPYVGESERNIAAAFQLAGQTGALLLIDEMDSFLQDRRKAERGWEVSMVNEMLTCLEGFNGVFVASTNLMQGLDQAALRRFDLKVKFDYLHHEQAWALLCRYCKKLDLGPPPPSLQASMRKLDRLTPGDYATVARQHRFLPLTTAALLVSALQDECAAKENSSRPIGFL